MRNTFKNRFNLKGVKMPEQTELSPAQIAINQERYVNFARLGEATLMVAQWETHVDEFKKKAVELNDKYEATKAQTTVDAEVVS